MSSEKMPHNTDIESLRWKNIPSTAKTSTTRNVPGTPLVLFSIYLGLTSLCAFICLMVITLHVRPTSTFVRVIAQIPTSVYLQFFVSQTIQLFYYGFNVMGPSNHG